jgi:ABC-type amino acid transport system permease subunit
MSHEIGHLMQTLLSGYPVPQAMISPGFPVLLQRIGGLLLTVTITAAALLAGFGLGVALVACCRNPLTKRGRDPGERIVGQALRCTAVAVTEGVRGLPIIVLILLVFNLTYPLTGLGMPGFLMAIVAFGLYAAVYLAESMRAGLRAIDPQLHAAGKVLGLTSPQIFTQIELPLVYRTMRPDLINIAVTVFTDTSALVVVAVPELSYTARQMLVSEPAHYGISPCSSSTGHQRPRCRP